MTGDGVGAVHRGDGVVRIRCDRGDGVRTDSRRGANACACAGVGHGDRVTTVEVDRTGGVRKSHRGRAVHAGLIVRGDGDRLGADGEVGVVSARFVVIVRRSGNRHVVVACVDRRAARAPSGHDGLATALIARVGDGGGESRAGRSRSSVVGLRRIGGRDARRGTDVHRNGVGRNVLQRLAEDTVLTAEADGLVAVGRDRLGQLVDNNDIVHGAHNATVTVETDLGLLVRTHRIDTVRRGRRAGAGR